MALGYVPTELSKHDTDLEVEINGKMYKASGNKIKSAEIKSAKIALIDLLSF